MDGRTVEGLNKNNDGRVAKNNKLVLKPVNECLDRESPHTNARIIKPNDDDVSQGREIGERRYKCCPAVGTCPELVMSRGLPICLTS